MKKFCSLFVMLVCSLAMFAESSVCTGKADVSLLSRKVDCTIELTPNASNYDVTVSFLVPTFMGTVQCTMEGENVPLENGVLKSDDVEVMLGTTVIPATDAEFTVNVVDPVTKAGKPVTMSASFVAGTFFALPVSAKMTSEEGFVPPIKSSVVFSLPYEKQTTGVVKAVALDGDVIEESWPGSSIDASVGQLLKIQLDEENYRVDSVVINGEKINSIEGCVYAVRISNNNTTVKIYATPVEMVEQYPVADTTTPTLPDVLVVTFNKDLPNVAYAVVSWGGTTKEVVESKCEVKGNKVYVNIADFKKYITYNTITVSLRFDEIDAPYTYSFTYAPCAVNNEFTATSGTIEFSQDIAFVYPPQNLCYISGVKTRQIAAQANLSLDEENGKILKVKVAHGEVLAPGEYTLDLPAECLQTADGSYKFPSQKIAFTVVAPKLTQTYPEANKKVTELPNKIIFMFDQEVSVDAIEKAYVQVKEETEPVVVGIDKVTVLDGNSVYVDITDLKDQIEKGQVTAGIVMTGVESPYETSFTYGDEFAVDLGSCKFYKDNAKLVFTENVDFYDGVSEVKCYVSDVKKKSIATQATLTLDDSDFKVINVTFAESLEVGQEYTLDIEDGKIISTAGEPLASVKIPFTVSPSTAIKTVETTSDNTSAVTYNIAGQRVANGFKGIVIMNGKKYMK